MSNVNNSLQNTQLLSNVLKEFSLDFYSHNVLFHFNCEPCRSL